MRTIPKERILRVNCLGYGTEAHWNLGRAKSLNNYSAIIVNPVSIAHLFDKDPELVRKVEQCLAEGNTQLNIDDDVLLRNLAAEIDSRVLELSDFLVNGGILVYFLCRPFIIQGPSLALDNYYWLESLAPDQPAERNVRHMSAVSHGRLIEPTEEGIVSEFAPYLQQHGLEWSTLIRTDFLTDGYNVMAEAGSKKCIAGQLLIVDSSGKVVFLPSPYSPDFDKTLIDCLNGWYTLKEQSPEELEAEENEKRVASATQPAETTPVSGSSLFEKEQSHYEPVASAMMDTGAHNYQAAAPAAASEPDEGFTFNADKIAETISQDARNFEEEVANRVARETKKPTSSIDLSIFAQTARQLVQKTTDTPPAAEEAAPAAASVPEMSAAEDADFDEEFEETVPAETEPNNNSPLRNILSSASPSLPESVKPSMPSPALSMLSDAEDSEFASPAVPPPTKPKNAAALFRDDDEFEDESFSKPAAVEPAEFSSQSEVDTSDSNSGVFSSDFSQPSMNSGNFNLPAASQPPSFNQATSNPTAFSQPTSESPSNNSGAYSQPNLSSPTNSSSSLPQLQSPTNSSSSLPQLPSPTNSSSSLPQLPSPTDSSSSLPQLQSPTDSSSSLPQLGANSGDFNTVELEDEPAPVPAESTVLQPPSGFMSNFENSSPQVENSPPSAEPPMAQTPNPSASPAGENSAVTNNDPSNHENKSTMDLLRELEKAQRPPEQARPPVPGPTATAPTTAPEAEAVRPLLNNLFKKDATETAARESSPPAVPQSAPPAAAPQASVPPPPVPNRNTLGALMQPAAESRVTVPQESLAMNREGSNAMSNMVVPDWCKQYSFSYLDELKKEQATLASELQDIQAKLNTVESKIASVEQLKSALLSGDIDAMKEATGLILGKLGWTINHNNAAPNEVLLLNVDQPEALVRIVRSEAHCDRSEVAQVSGSAIAFWEKHDIEPKGLLIASTWANISPTSRNQKDFEEPVAEFAKKKNLCLISSIQMLGIYRDLELGLTTPDAVRRQMLETSGLLIGYTVDAGAMVGARA